MNQEHLAAIARAEGIAPPAQKGTYAFGLAALGLAADFATNLLTTCAAVRPHLSTAQSPEAAQAGDVGPINRMRTQLISYMQQAQAWAWAKFFFASRRGSRSIMWASGWIRTA